MTSNTLSTKMEDISKNLTISESKHKAFNVGKIVLSYVDANQEAMKNLLFNRLEKYGIVPEDFSKLLKKNGAVLTGSFPLQAILEETWDNSDIDIFMLSEENDPYFDKMMSYFEKRFITSPDKKDDKKDDKKNEGKQENIPNPKVKKNNHYQYSIGKEIRDIYDSYSSSFNGDKIKVQLVSIEKKLIKYTSIVDYVNNTFDLSFCTITYDGEKFTHSNWEDIYEKRGSMNLRKNVRFSNDYSLLTQTLKREEKYRLRGFNITKSVEIQNEIKQIILTLYNGQSYLTEITNSHINIPVLQETIFKLYMKYMNSTKIVLSFDKNDNYEMTIHGNKERDLMLISGKSHKELLLKLLKEMDKTAVDSFNVVMLIDLSHEDSSIKTLRKFFK